MSENEKIFRRFSGETCALALWMCSRLRWVSISRQLKLLCSQFVSALYWLLTSRAARTDPSIFTFYFCRFYTIECFILGACVKNSNKCKSTVMRGMFTKNDTKWEAKKKTISLRSRSPNEQSAHIDKMKLSEMQGFLNTIWIDEVEGLTGTSGVSGFEEFRGERRNKSAETQKRPCNKFQTDVMKWIWDTFKNMLIQETLFLFLQFQQDYKLEPTCAYHRIQDSPSRNNISLRFF